MQIIKHKTKILFVDDDKDQISSLQKAINLSGMDCIVYTDAQKALEEINMDVKRDTYNLNNIVQLFKNNKYKKQISTVISDYSMPELNGVELLNQINNKDIYKILYTGVADEKEGIKALNKDNIDVYYHKGQDIEDLINFLREGEDIYFRKLISPYLNKIKEDMYTNILYSKKYNEFFTKIVKNFSVIEYCLIDENGSFILIDKKGKIYTLLVMSNNSLDAELDIAKELKLSKKIVQDIKNKEKMIYISKYNKFEISDIINCEQLDCEDETIKYAFIKKDIFKIIHP